MVHVCLLYQICYTIVWTGKKSQLLKHGIEMLVNYLLDQFARFPVVESELSFGKFELFPDKANLTSLSLAAWYVLASLLEPLTWTIVVLPSSTLTATQAKTHNGTNTNTRHFRQKEPHTCPCDILCTWNRCSYVVRTNVFSIYKS